MNGIKLFNVSSAIPAQIGFLETLSRNLWWSWNHDAIELFRRINPQLWKDSGHNPLVFLNRIPQKELEDLVEDDGFLSHMEQVRERFELEAVRPESGENARPPAAAIAYFSLEYGIHESIRLYAGGLGCLAGDVLKEASDMNLEMVGVGLLYRQGHFHQYLNNDGWQQEAYEESEIHHMPLKPACDRENRQIRLALQLPEGELQVIVWRLDVGRVPLYLLDTNLSDNKADFRKITARIYGEDRQLRMRQELLLGLVGFRALVAADCEPRVCHMNEGHAAFLCLERISHLMKSHGLDKETAFELVRRTNVFTTHTPVPAGNETFPADLARKHLEPLESDLGLEADEIIAWGHAPDGDNQHELSMTILGLRLAEHSNGVSRLHGKIERGMWAHLWPGRPPDEIPINHITNGVHIASWLSSDNILLFDKYLGPEWRNNPAGGAILQRLPKIPDEELWHAHGLGRARMIRMAREIGERQLDVRHEPRSDVDRIKSAFHYDTLTIVFARRFASYKRAMLLLMDRQRFEALLLNDERPIQIIFAGKAHPADEIGKDIIRQIVEFARKSDVRHRVMFLENYDIRMARYLAQGADVWLNTPRRPHEASGTSGMKAAANGGLHLSVLDGWWAEGYVEGRGWAIGRGEEYDNPEYNDMVESQALYNILEDEIIPRFYDRSDGGIPVAWTRMMKASMGMALSEFTSHRMLSEYNSLFYEHAFGDYSRLLDNGAEHARKLVVQRERLKALWEKVEIEAPEADRDVSLLHVGDRFNVTANVRLGDLNPDEVDAEVYYGPVNAENRIAESSAEKMSLVEKRSDGRHMYRREIACERTGSYGFTARVTPRGRDWKSAIPGFITWPDE